MSSELTTKLTDLGPGIHRYIRGMVRNDADAEDLTQETLLRAQRSLDSLDVESKLAPWLYRIATNICYDRFRQASIRGRPVSLDAGGGDDDASPPDDAAVDTRPRLDKAFEQAEMGECVQRYVADLSDSQRAVIMLHDMKGMTNPEISVMLGLSLENVKIRLHRAREKLRDALGKGCSFSRDERGVILCDPKPPDPEP
jgi:RNA polymerase sigma-70 factor (ECF subfamily)